MKRYLILCLVICVLLSGCYWNGNSVYPKTYSFEFRDEPIESIELFYYPWYNDPSNGDLVNQFCLIRELTAEEVPVFMDSLYSLKTTRSSFGDPPSGLGEFIAKVTYENGYMEYFGSTHFEMVAPGEMPAAVGIYSFDEREAFEGLFFEYAELSENQIKSMFQD